MNPNSGTVCKGEKIWFRNEDKWIFEYLKKINSLLADWKEERTGKKEILEVDFWLLKGAFSLRNHTVH